MGIMNTFGTCNKVAIGTLDGSKSKNYTIVSWRQISGVKAQIEEPNKIVSRIGFDVNGERGIAYFELTIKDSLGRIAKDTVIGTIIK